MCSVIQLAHPCRGTRRACHRHHDRLPGYGLRGYVEVGEQAEERFVGPRLRRGRPTGNAEIYH